MGKQLTTKQFIQRAKKVHGDKFDYSKVDYKGMRFKVTLICNDCNPPRKFQQNAGNHLNGAGCDKCGRKKVGDKMRDDKASFVKKAKKKHGYKYNYSEVNYKGCYTPVTIICPEHGRFSQKPCAHIYGQGCRKCGNIISANSCRKTIEQFIEEANIAHNNFYNYEKFVYVNDRTAGTIICPIHGEFQQTPDAHLHQKHGCTDCGRVTQGPEKRTQDSIIKQAQEIHQNLYTYLHFVYTGYHDKSLVTCKIHGDFPVSPAAHLSGRCGCPHCINKTEGKLKIWFQRHFGDKIKATGNVAVTWCKTENGIMLKFDFISESLMLIIELDGLQHFEYTPHFHRNGEKDLNDQQQRDCLKMKKANENGYSVIRLLQEDVWNNKNNWEEKLLEAIKKYDTPTNIFICSNNEYETQKN
jgi:hypothetical protein